jgi:TetR/AcrR family transcriptional repressor of nem operon
MVDGATPSGPPRITARGVVTRDRILRAASEMMRVKGVEGTTFDEVRAASGTSKSQIYHHFPNKEALVREVVALWGRWRIEEQEQYLGRLDSIRGLERWRNAIVQQNRLVNGAHGCIIGALAGELSDHDEHARLILAAIFQSWEALFVEGFERMRAAGVLEEDVDPVTLATAVMAALQGGYLLAQTQRSSGPMEVALDMAVAHVRSYALVPESPS